MTTQSLQRLTFVAADQGGLVTGRQAARAGVDGNELKRLASASLLIELDWDVHQLSASPLAPRFAYPYAAWLALAPELFRSERPAATHEDAVLSHGSAARLHGLGAVSAPRTTFIAPAGTTPPRAVEVQVAPLSATEVTVVGGVPVTTPHRTILDLVRAHTDHGEVRGALTEAVRRDLVELSALYDALVPLAAQHEFPADGPEFAGYFLPGLEVSSLSPRNLRALAGVVRPDRVAEVGRLLTRALATAPGGDRADERLVRGLAADIVGRTERI